MKAKQTKLKAKLPLELHEISGGAYCHDKGLMNAYKIIDKTTEKTIVDCRISMGRSRSASTVYADLWVSGIKDNKIPKKADYTYTIDNCYNDEPRTFTSNSLSGKGSAGGYGYDKASAAVADAIDSCGITLWGTPYHGQEPDFKKQAHIGGTGVVEGGLLAIAYACGYNNVILVKV